MQHHASASSASCAFVVLALGALCATPLALAPAGCSATPKSGDRSTFLNESDSTLKWFESNVSGVKGQIAGSSGYIVFPNVGEGGFIIGGTFGRGAVYDARGKQIGWAAVNKASIGLQVGGQGYKMLIVLQDDATLRRFKNSSWSGDVGATAVAGEAGGSATAPFQDGVAVYIGDQSGLMAGMRVALANIVYRNIADAD